MKNEKLKMLGSLKTVFFRLKQWVEDNKVEAGLLFLILFLASFFRLWRIDEYLPFLGDEGRDVRVVGRFVTQFDLMFIGPRTSIGDMYLGPLYYYLIAPFLFLFGLSPVGPAVFVALLGIATVWLVWYMGREWFGVLAGLISSFLYAISPSLISQSKHSWNPNIMPFFALLAVYSSWRVWQKKDFKFLLVLGFALATVLQSHYLGLLLFPTIGVVWLMTLVGVWNKRRETKKFLVFSLLSFLLFLGLMSPLVVFDASHGWRNLGAVKTFFADRQTTVSARPWNALPSLWPLWNQKLVSDLLLVKDDRTSIWLSVLLIVATIASTYWLYRRKLPQGLKTVGLIGIWLGAGLIGLGLYKQSIYEHYLGFMFPVPFLLMGFVAQVFWDRKRKWLILLLVAILAGINLRENPLKFPPQRQLQRTQMIDKKIIEESGNQPFNFAIIAKRNYEEGYLYFFELWKVPVREIDPQRMNETLTNQLFVVCEDPVCEPINNAKAEVANFGWAKIDQEWEVGGIKVFKLLHAK